MKTLKYFLPVVLAVAGGVTLGSAQTNAPPPAIPTSPSSVAATAAQTNTPPADAPTSPPSAAPKRSAADLEKMVAPIALYPDQLIATVLPASAYPLEIVQAARFVKDTNNIAKIDTQSWDENVKAVAKFPDVVAQMDANIAWTSDLGDAFINQPKELMDAIQTMRNKAQGSGALKTTPEQVVTVTNQIVTNVVETQTVVVTNQVVQIEPAQPEVIYVPQYNPTVVYGGTYPAYPGYYPPPAPAYYPGAALLSFGAGMAAGAIIANNCDWGHGGCWGGSYHSDVDIDVDRNVNANINRNNANVNRNTANANRNTANANRGQGQKWQPDQNRLKNSGSTMSSSQNREARGYSSASSRAGSGTSRTPSASAGSRPTPTPTGRPSSPSASRPDASRPSSPSASRPDAASRPSSPSASRPDAASRPSSPSASRPDAASRPSSPSASSRPSSSPSASRPSPSSSSQRSAFSGSGSGGGATRQASARGGGSRGGGGGGRR